MPLTGEAKRRYQRAYMRQARAQLGEIKRAVVGAMRPGPGPAPTVKDEAAQGALRSLLETEGLPARKLLRKLRDKLDSTRPYVVAVAGPKGERVTIQRDDNDAQLRAVDIALKLHERAGTIPSDRAPGPSGMQITVIEVMYAAAAVAPVVPVPGVTGDADALQG